MASARRFGEHEVQRTEIERWIVSNLRPKLSSSAELTYERMPSQSGERLAVIYQPLDCENRGHWHDVAIVSAFATALEGASSVLDIGPGDGWPSLRIADRFGRVVGVDPSPLRVRVQRQNAARLGIGNVDFLEMDAVSLDFEDGSFGGVAAASSIEQSDDPPRALREVFRVLEPGGRLAMIFEDYGGFFPDTGGDEELWSEDGEGYRVLFYQARTKSPPRETKYGLFLDGDAVVREAGVAAVLDGLAQDPARLENLEDGREGPIRPEELSVGFFEELRPLVREASYFELHHLTSASLDAVLAHIGFADIRHFDCRLPELLDLVDGAREAGKMEQLAALFPLLPELWGRAAVRGAGRGPGDFAIARKPSY